MEKHVHHHPAQALPLSYYQQEDVIALSKDLLGKVLVTCIEGQITSGVIIETEAYRGPEDRASHAYQNRRTPRNEVMYAHGGHSYVYLCYGIHPLFNVVTNRQEIPHAVLIRAILPLAGIDTMQARRNSAATKKLESQNFGVGPGNVTKCLGITRAHNGFLLNESPVWIEDHKISFDEMEIAKLPRVGIDYAGADALLPWRFCVSKKQM